MADKKKIECRVCGKLFEPCSYCQTHADVFRWRNFACSKECAAKYADMATAYRESQRKKSSEPTANAIVENTTNVVENTETQTPKKKTTRRKAVEPSVEVVE